VDFLLVLIELFSLGVTAEALQRISIENRRFCSNGVMFDSKFQVQGVVIHQPFFILKTRITFFHVV